MDLLVALVGPLERLLNVRDMDALTVLTCRRMMDDGEICPAAVFFALLLLLLILLVLLLVWLVLDLVVERELEERGLVLPW
jgi:hypothetical protein